MLSLAGATAFFYLAASSVAQQAPTSPITPEAELTAKYNASNQAFADGRWQEAVQGFEEVLKFSAAHQVPQEQLGPVYYALGAAYFNLGQYPKAVETLKMYQEKFPKGDRAADVAFSIGQASMMTKDFNEAAAQFAKAAGVPQFREQALYYGAVALKESGRTDEAIRGLEALVSPEIRNALGVKGAMMLARLYGEKKEAEKANAIVAKVLQKTELVEDLARLNTMAVELGDDHLQAGRTTEALAVYRLVRTRGEVIQFQADRVVALQKKLGDTMAAMRANPKEAAQLLGALNQLHEDIDEAKKLLEEAKKLPEFMPGIWLRIGRAYYEMRRHWESLVAYDEILTRYPDAKEREAVMFGATVDYAEANRPQSARKTGEQYLKEFPAGPNASTVGYLMGATALQADDPATAETYFGRMLKEQPNSSFKEEMRLLLGHAEFAQGKFEEAVKDYERYLADFSKGGHVEEASYRIAVGLVFAGQYEKAIPVIEKYLETYPKGTYAPDARYRLALCYYAASQYEDVIKRCTEWEKDYGQDQQLGEVLALHADALMAKGSSDEAIDTYVRSYKAATTDEVLNYSLFEAQKGMQKKGDWPRMSGMFEEFVKEHPEHPLVPMSLFWIGKAKAREGKVEEAKQFLADTIKKYLDDPRREAVEQMLSQLAQLCAKKKQPAQAVATPVLTSGTALALGTGPTATPVATPTPEPQVDPGAELDKLLGDGGDSQSETAKARVIYAKSELARCRRKPDEQKKQMETIVQNFKPADLSPMLLALAGDQLLDAGDMEKAAGFYQQLMDEYPKSPVVDFAFNGLGEIAYQKQDYDKALRLFNAIVDDGNANQKLKDVTLGRAKTLLALGKLDEAQKVFEQVASVREWRGDATAQAVYSLGEIQFKRGKWAEANAFYQRVFVAYQKFLPWVAKSYLQSAECFQKLGKTPEAARTYQEMLRNGKLANFKETETARKRLQEIGGGS